MCLVITSRLELEEVAMEEKLNKQMFYRHSTWRQTSPDQINELDMRDITVLSTDMLRKSMVL